MANWALCRLEAFQARGPRAVISGVEFFHSAGVVDMCLLISVCCAGASACSLAQSVVERRCIFQSIKLAWYRAC